MLLDPKTQTSTIQNVSNGVTGQDDRLFEGETV